MSNEPAVALRNPGWSIVAGAIGWLPVTCIAGVWPWLPDETLPLGALVVWITWCVVTHLASRQASSMRAAIMAAVGVPFASLAIGAILLALYALLGDYAAETGHAYAIGEHFALMQWAAWPALAAAGVASAALAASTAHARRSAGGEAVNVLVVVLGAAASLAITYGAPARYDLAPMLDEHVLATTSLVPGWMVRPPLVAFALAAMRSWQLRASKPSPGGRIE